MRKKLLFFIESLEVGGAEKSLVTLLSSANLNQYDVDLIMLKKGTFLKDVPNHINVLFVENLKPAFFKRIQYFILKKLNKGNLHAAQYFWKLFKNDFRRMPASYDIAIAYGQGFATYFVAENVEANKKIAWVNTDYEAVGFNGEFDILFYKKMNAIVAVSNLVKKSLAGIELILSTAVPLVVISDITDTREIFQKSDENVADFPKAPIIIASVGRLVKSKGFKKAIAAAKLLKEKGIQFEWLIIGEGSERERLELLIKTSELQNEVKLLGMRENPYPYVKSADIYVQTSFFEGLGLSLIEARILGKPVVTTNFPTAFQIIKHGETGLICDMNSKSIAENLEKLILGKDLREKFSVSDAPYYNDNKERSLEKFYKLLE